MRKFARCVLILILVVIISGIGGYFYENSTTTKMYESVSRIYVVPGSDSEASIRAKNGGLNKDFMIIFSSNVVIEAAQRIAGTSEDISEYLTVSSPADSNIVELRIVNPDQNTAKTYVDAIAKTAVRTTTIIPVESMQILSEGTSTGVAFKPHLYRNTIIIVGIASAACVFIELVVCLVLCAFKKKEDNSDDEYEYEARFGRYVYPGQELISHDAHRLPYKNTKKDDSDDILASFDDDDDTDFLAKNVDDKQEDAFEREAAAGREPVFVTEPEEESAGNLEDEIDKALVEELAAEAKKQEDTGLKSGKEQEKSEPKPEKKQEKSELKSSKEQEESELESEKEREESESKSGKEKEESELNAMEEQKKSEPEVEKEQETSEPESGKKHDEYESEIAKEEEDLEPEIEKGLKEQKESELKLEEAQEEAEPEIEEKQEESDPETESEEETEISFDEESELETEQDEDEAKPETAFNIRILGKIVK